MSPPAEPRPKRRRTGRRGVGRKRRRAEWLGA
jgi:hypothetical protein